MDSHDVSLYKQAKNFFRLVYKHMQIRNVSQYNINQPSFGTLFRMLYYTDCYGRSRYTQNSTGVRDDLNYDELASLIKDRFSKCSKINLMPMNGSDGTESYLIANSIINTFGEKEAKEKIFPVLVTDVDPKIVEQYGKKGIVALKDEDIKAFGNNFDRFFERANKWELPMEEQFSRDLNAYRLKPDFKNLFKFEVMDFQKRMKEVKDGGNSIFIIRNCLTESFGVEETKKIVKDLSSLIHPNSLFVIGGYDRKHMSDFIPTLEFLGFREIGKNIFSLNGSNSKSVMNNPLFTKCLKKF